jgi:hypothetical protein
MTRLSSVGLSSKKMMTGHVMTGLSSFCFFLKGLMTKSFPLMAFMKFSAHDAARLYLAARQRAP